MRTSRMIIGGLAMVAALGFSAPASAAFIPVTLTSFATIPTEGEGATIAPYGSIDYIGPSIIHLQNIGNFIVFCDDFANTINPKDVPFDYFASTTLADAEAYQDGLSATVIHEIEGLTFEGTQLAASNSLSPSQGAAYQMAIWRLQNPGLTATAPAGLDADADALILLSGGV